MKLTGSAPSALVGWSSAGPVPPHFRSLLVREEDVDRVEHVLRAGRIDVKERSKWDVFPLKKLPAEVLGEIGHYLEPEDIVNVVRLERQSFPYARALCSRHNGNSLVATLAWRYFGNRYGPRQSIIPAGALPATSALRVGLARCARLRTSKQLKDFSQFFDVIPADNSIRHIDLAFTSLGSIGDSEKSLARKECNHSRSNKYFTLFAKSYSTRLFIAKERERTKLFGILADNLLGRGERAGHLEISFNLKSSDSFVFRMGVAKRNKAAISANFWPDLVPQKPDPLVFNNIQRYLTMYAGCRDASLDVRISLFDSSLALRNLDRLTSGNTLNEARDTLDGRLFHWGFIEKTMEPFHLARSLATGGTLEEKLHPKFQFIFPPGKDGETLQAIYSGFAMRSFDGFPGFEFTIDADPPRMHTLGDIISFQGDTGLFHTMQLLSRPSYEA